MRKIKSILLIGTAIFVLACTEEIPVDNTNFIKYFGRESGTFGNALYEYPNGNLVVGCKVDVPAFDFTNVGGSFTVGKVVEGTMALIESDKNGLQTNFSSYPISSHQTVPEVILTDLAGKSLINQVIPTSDGGFMISGEWRGIGATLIINTDTLVFEPGSNVTAPFLLKVRSNNTIEFIRSFNGETGWDGTYHAIARMRLLDDGTIGVLLGLNVYNFYQPATDLFEGYRFLKIDQQGNTLFTHDFHEPQLKIKLVRDFIIDASDNFIGIGQYNDFLRLYSFNLNSPGNESVFPLDGSGMAPGVPNTNDFFIEQFSDGSYVVAYPDPGNNSRIAFVSNDFQAGSPIIHTQQNEYPRALRITSDEHILVYTEYLATTTVPEGFLYKLDRQGKTIFRKRFEGTPGDVIESRDGTYMVLSNPLFNGLIPKARLTKLSKDGKTY